MCIIYVGEMKNKIEWLLYSSNILSDIHVPRNDISSCQKYGSFIECTWLSNHDKTAGQGEEKPYIQTGFTSFNNDFVSHSPRGYL